MNCWQILHIEPTADSKVIRRAYSQQLKLHKPEVDAVGYQRVREAYEQALRQAEYLAQDEDEFDAFEDATHSAVPQQATPPTESHVDLVDLSEHSDWLNQEPPPSQPEISSIEEEEEDDDSQAMLQRVQQLLSIGQQSIAQMEQHYQTWLQEAQPSLDEMEQFELTLLCSLLDKIEHTTLCRHWISRFNWQQFYPEPFAHPYYNQIQRQLVNKVKEQEFKAKSDTYTNQNGYFNQTQDGSAYHSDHTNHAHHSKGSHKTEWPTYTPPPKTKWSHWKTFFIIYVIVKILVFLAAGSH